MLCKIVVLVDYYELYDILYFFCDLWINELRYFLSKAYCRDLIIWICITSIFTSSSKHKGPQPSRRRRLFLGSRHFRYAAVF